MQAKPALCVQAKYVQLCWENCGFLLLILVLLIGGSEIQVIGMMEYQPETGCM